MRSTVSRIQERGRERLVGETQLDGGEGGRLTEDVTVYPGGVLGRMEARLDAVGGRPAKRVVMDAVAGSIDITTDSFSVHWNVPTDLPWVWAPLLTVLATGVPVTSPVDARVVWRATANGRSVRLLDLGILAQYAVTADQLAVADAKGGTVVLANDAVDIEEGMPKRLHLAAIDANVDALSAGSAPGTLVAAARCLSAKPLTAE